MKTHKGIRRAVAAAFMAGSLAWGTSWAGAMDGALALEFDGAGMASVSDTVTGGAPRVFRFWAKEGDVVTLDIDNAMPVDTILSVHTSDNYTVERVIDDTDFLDEGSAWPMDPMIQNWVVPADGVYYAVVTVSPDRVADGGTFLALGGGGSGPFTLIVSGVSPEPAGGGTETPPADTETPTPPADQTDSTPPSEPETPSVPTAEVKQVRIDVRPGHRSLVRLNPRWKQSIPVAILASRGFDVRDVDVSSLTFGRSGDEQSLRGCSKRTVRVNRDRRPDLVCQFENQMAGFELGDEEGVLKGVMKNGTPFEGRGMLRVLPEKRHYGHRHGHGHGKHKRADDDRRHKGHSHRTSWHR